MSDGDSGLARTGEPVRRRYGARRKAGVALVGAVLTLVAAACSSSGKGSGGNSSGEPAPAPGSSGPGSSAPAQPVHLTMQLSWVPEAQFAGFLVAKAKGFYSDAGLDVDIKSG